MNKFVKTILKTLLGLFVLLNIVVIFHAYKFTYYYETGDKSVIQQGMKSGWDKTSDMLFGINAAKQPNVAPDTAYDPVTLTTKDSLKLSSWNMTVPNAKGTVLLFHGHGSKKSALMEEAHQFRKLGYNTFLTDFRAHGSSEGNTCTIGYTETEDIKLAYEYVQSLGEDTLVLYGISMGAATVAKAISEYALKPYKVILEMPFGSLTEAVKGRVKMMQLPAEPISTLLTFWGGTIHGFWAFNYNVAQYAQNIKSPILLQWGATDPRVTKKETDDVFAAIAAPKKLVVYEQSGHQSLAANESTKWQENVKAFLEK